MKHKMKLMFAAFAFVFMAGSAFISSTKNGPCDAPLLGAGHSGAPGEVNCTGCHGGTPNTGSGSLLFDLGGGTNDYTPGQTYTATVKLSQTEVNKFGFQVIALKDSNDSFIGSYTLTDPTNTRIINGSVGKKYVGTTRCGSDAASLGSIQWSFDWTAPSTNQGTITFYLSSLATNHNNSTTGDDTYIKTLKLSPKSTGIYPLSVIESSFQVYPNPTSGNVTLQYELEHRTFVKISIQDLEGRELDVISSGIQSNGKHSYVLDLIKKGYTSGTYIIKMKTGTQTFTKILNMTQ
jgi:Secretion system C-terminal sorting domain/Reeler domain